MSSKFLHGSDLLQGDSTIPGVRMPDELKKLLPRIYQEVTKFGCDYYDTVVEMLAYDDISEIAAYGGFPVRYPHWKFGMEYEELQRGYEHGMHRIYEMVINTNPCYIYCLNSNTLVDNVTVVIHALFHCDFFKNNIFFKPTSQNMMNQLANNGSRIRRIIQRWGKEKVTEFIDHVLRVDTLIDPAMAWQQKTVKDLIITDHRTITQPTRLNVKEGHEYMEDYINPADWKASQRERVERFDVAREIGIFQNESRDILGYIRNHAPLKPWQQDILAMLYEEALYFAPQRTTKMVNEGWASYGDFKVGCEAGFISLGQPTPDSGIIEYGSHKWGVLGGKYSQNPYKLGFTLFRDIEERWNKGQFGTEWENEKDITKKENWDTKAMKGREKVFEVRKNYNDFTMLSEFFTPEFCHKNEFFEWKHYPNGEWRVESRDYKKIKKKMMSRYLNGGLPDIRLADPNYQNKGYLMLQHYPDVVGKTLYDPYLRPTLQSLYALWQNDVYLATYDKEGEEIVYVAEGTDDDSIRALRRSEFEGER